MILEQRLQRLLSKRQETHHYRTRVSLNSGQGVSLNIEGREYHNFCSNDYLGLASHPDMILASREALEKFGCGSGASHLVSGHQQLHHQLEEALAKFCGRERALLFSTGFMANVGVLSALAERGDRIYQDRLNHASLLDGGLLSRAELIRYRHNDLDQLESLLKRDQQQSGQAFIVTDGVFSMDGDVAAISALVNLANRYQAVLMVDDAHGIGVLGERGAGCVEDFDQSQVPILMGTLGKAFGSLGAFVAGSSVLIESLIQLARPYIYTTALPPATAAASLKALDIIQQEPQRRVRLAKRIQQFRELAHAHAIPMMESHSAIQPVLTGSEAQTLAVSEALKQRGFLVGCIRPPTVPKGSARLRITLCSEHEPDVVEQLVLNVAEVMCA